jgi:oligopeptide transport system permease protein
MIETGLLQRARYRLANDRLALGCAGALVLIVMIALLAPIASPWSIDAVDWDYFAGPPTLHGSHWFGTDASGRDLFVRVLYGVRISLLVAVLATLVSLIVGVTWGATAGYFGGRVDEILMRIVDVLYALPYLFFVIILTVVFGSNLFLIFIAIGAVGWLTMARVVRGQTLAVRRREFVEAAIVSGVPARRIIRQHIIPNVIGPVIVYATLTVPQIILFESFLSFLGLGVQEPFTSLGKLIAAGALEMESSPWMLIIPGAFLATLLLCFNFIGDGLRDALDPRDG